jgi:hypothetical protein
MLEGGVERKEEEGGEGRGKEGKEGRRKDGEEVVGFSDDAGCQGL